MDRWLLLGALTLLALVSPPAAARAELTLPPGFSQVTVASGLSDPTAIAYAPDGRLFIAEKIGVVRVVNPGSPVAHELTYIVPHVARQGDRGLLGIAVDAEFETNHYLYLLYTYETDETQSTAPKTARLTRIEVNPDNTVEHQSTPEEETVLLGKVGIPPCPAPSNDVDCIPSTSDSHSIGTVRADPDGTLWVGSGDGAGYNAMDPDALRTYDERSLSGKILHVDRNGRGLPDHPFCPDEQNLDRVCTKLYAKGFRNPFRFQLRPGAGPIAGDVGWASTEELDLLAPGESYGWPCYEGAAQTPDYQELPECQALYDDGSQTPPAFSYDHGAGGGGAVEAGPQYTASHYPAEWHDAWFFADYVQGWIKAYDIKTGKVANVRPFATAGYDGVDLETTPQGDLVYLRLTDGSDNSGQVSRIVYGNAPPPAHAHATPASGSPPLTVSFTADESIDPDGDAVSYAWDFDGDGVEDASGRTATHEYTEKGPYVAKLTVTDARGLASEDSVEIAVGAVPVATIDAPADGSLFRHGVAVPLRASATDADEPELPDSAYSWRILLHHGSHVHLVATALPGAEQSFVPAGDHDADSYYEIRLTVTDRSGLHSTATAAIHPETIPLTLASSPPGVPLTYSAVQYTAPVRREAAIGYRTSVAAPDTFVSGGTTYRFAAWSDHGARQHPFTVPATATTLTATYAAQGGATGATGAPAPASAGGGPARPEPAPPVRLRVDRAHRHARTLTGAVTGPAARPRVLVALRTVSLRGRCRHWSRDSGRLQSRARHCGSIWMRAAVTSRGDRSWRWRVALRGTLRRGGRYVITTRVTDAQGRTLRPARSARLR
jgi:glucose/arabinose dehydrogenase